MSRTNNEIVLSFNTLFNELRRIAKMLAKTEQEKMTVEKINNYIHIFNSSYGENALIELMADKIVEHHEAIINQDYDTLLDFKLSDDYFANVLMIVKNAKQRLKPKEISDIHNRLVGIVQDSVEYLLNKSN